ncbi:signal recognition particle receptor FtsY [Acidocella aquatica]|uniref:Signal recognition particle receptor FtsY n=1 Tax=Acidocella aquatica TaxID=1922313 RepID=A0ABQ6A737_9PROT|nr:signal recognition particle-docking protein FtsY [Acidocella aquatica]GLR67676.1 signal recognition particle receptor FtsY [Acidocella aquatica]
MASGFFGRLKAGLSRSAAKLTGGIAEVFTKRKLDDAALEELEEQLIAADLGPTVAARIIKNFRSTRFGKEVSPQEVRETLAAEIGRILAPVAKPLEVDTAKKPFVILMAGVNGAGKTTTIGKLAARYRQAGLMVMMAAGDTFRAAAVEQLQVWGARAGAEVVTAPANSDAASLAHDALARAQKAGADVLLIDTAGRLHNKTALMEELRKIIRVIRKLDESAPHAVLLTLDATTGQNAVTQVGIFKDMVDLTGLIVTKLDGSARGGIVVALAEKFGLPIHAVGTGEQIDDLRAFDPEEFARALVGE